MSEPEGFVCYDKDVRMPTVRDVEQDMQAEIDRLNTALSQCSYERTLLARLAADTQQFFNPLEAMAARALRDRVLAAAAKEPGDE